jgi:DNA-binding transcriptional LysR family regulator
MASHELEELPSTALDGENLGDDRRSLRQNILQAPSALAERQGAQIGTVYPEKKVESDIGRRPRRRRS